MILVIIAITLILRLTAINQSLWLDEAINVNNAATLSPQMLFFNYPLGDFHPPLYHFLLHFWIKLAGTSEIAVRLPSVLLGALGVIISYLIAKKLFEERTARISALLLATAPLAIYYSQEARMYTLAATLASLSVFFFISLIQKEKSWYWLGFIASTVLMLYTDYLPYLLLPTYIFYLIKKRKEIKKHTIQSFIPAFILILILIAPWLILVFPAQMKVGLSAAAASPAWAQVVGEPSLKNFFITFVKFAIGRISHDNNLIYASLFAPVGILLSFLFTLSLLRIQKYRSFLIYWLALPLILGFSLAFFVPIYSYFRFIFVLPAFYLLLASAVNIIHWSPLNRVFLLLLLAVNLTCTAIYFTEPKFHREDWRSATSFVINSSTPNTIVIFESNFSMPPFDYYNQNRLPAVGILPGFWAEKAYIGQNLPKVTEQKDRIYLFQYLSGITDPDGLVAQELFKLGFVTRRVVDFNGVGLVYELQR